MNAAPETHSPNAAEPPLTFELPAPDISAWRAGNTGTEGVWHFDSGQPGRHVMISALVHGNELCGAWALKGLLEAGVRPQEGTLTLAFCNLDAFDRFDASSHDASRFTDEDLNRQWLDERIDAGNTAERRRAAALRPFVARADWLLDIHSMHEPSAPLLLTGIQPRNLDLARAMRSPSTSWWTRATRTACACATTAGSACRTARAKPPTPARCWSNAASMAIRPAAPWRRTSACAFWSSPA